MCLSAGGGTRGRGARGCRVLALVVAVGQVADREAREIADRANGEHDPGIRNQQRKEQHHRDEDGQHHLGRDALAHPLAGEDRQPRDHQHGNRECVEEGQKRRAGEPRNA